MTQRKTIANIFARAEINTIKSVSYQVCHNDLWARAQSGMKVRPEICCFAKERRLTQMQAVLAEIGRMLGGWLKAVQSL